MHMPVETSLGRSNVMIRVTSLTYGTSKLKSYTHNRLERFITLQDLAPIIRVLHSFPEPMGRVRNRRITISYRGFFWRIGPRANMSCQSQSDWNFREHGMHINHGDARPGLRKAGSAKDSLSDPPFLQGWVFTRIPINIILVKDRDSPSCAPGPEEGHRFEGDRQDSCRSCKSGFASKAREVQLRACYSCSTNITQHPERSDSETVSS